MQIIGESLSGPSIFPTLKPCVVATHPISSYWLVLLPCSLLVTARGSFISRLAIGSPSHLRCLGAAHHPQGRVLWETSPRDSGRHVGRGHDPRREVSGRRKGGRERGRGDCGFVGLRNFSFFESFGALISRSFTPLMSRFLAPAAGWGGRDFVNPGYFAPAWYKIFAVRKQGRRKGKIEVREGMSCCSLESPA